MFSGGFVGVDIFFVISGYLITTILIGELDEGRFSIVNFYERRARRILPALFVVLAATILCAFLFMTIEQIKSHFEAIVAVCLFVSNFFFWRQIDYFAPAAELSPLLHTWSLAVEEQYYLLFPPLLAVLWRFGRRALLWVILVALVLSFVASEVGWRVSADANFFLAPTRAWELLIGSVCAFMMQKQGPTGRQIPALLGLLMILASIFVYDESVPFPSAYALLPTVGTALIILYATQATFAGRLLSIKPMVGIGLVSYSAYLWHQPLFAFARIGMVKDPSIGVMLILSVFSFILAYLSWRFVEAPFRKSGRSGGFGRKVIFAFSGVGMAVFILTGVIGISAHGFPGRLSPPVLHAMEAAEDRSPTSKSCFHVVREKRDDGLRSRLPGPDCVFPSGAAKIDVAVIGDSHAEAMGHSIIKSLNASGVSATEISSPACPPFPGFDKPKFVCSTFGSAVNTYLQETDIPVVVFIARYSMLFLEAPFDNTVGGVEHAPMFDVTFTAPVCEDLTPECRWRNAVAIVRAEFEMLSAAGKDIVIVYPVPEAGWNVPETYAKVLRYRGQTELSYPIEAYEQRYGKVVEFLDGLEYPRLRRVRPASIFCDSFEPGQCVQARDGDVYYFDDDHLSVSGADLVAPLVTQAVLRDLAAR